MKKTSFLLFKVAIFIATLSLSARGATWEDGQPNKSSFKGMTEETPSFISSSVITCTPANPDVCVGEVVTYSATNMAGATYLWNVSGGTAPPTTGNSTTVTWGNTGTGQVSLTVLSSLGDTLKTCNWQVTIHALPQPIISSSFNSGCDRKGGEQGHLPPGERDDSCFRACDSTTVVYSAPLNAGSSYTWSVTGAISYTPSQNTVSVYWGSVGNGTVGVIETDVYGCSNYTEVCVTIIESPIALFTTIPAPNNGLIELCMSTSNLSQTLYFIDQSTAGVNTISNWYWDFGYGPTSVAQNPTHQFPGPGLYDVWLVVENECHCKDSTLLQVLVHPEIGPDISCASTVCAGATETYTTSATCALYNWVVQGGTINQAPPYGNSISVTWGSTGPGVVSLDVSGCAPYCNSPTSILIPIISPTTNIAGPSVVCANSLNSSYSVSYLPGCIYSWNVTGGTITSASNTNQISVYWPPGSGGTVSVTYTNTVLNCMGQASMNVVVGPEFSISGPTDICLPSSSGTANYNGPAAGSFNWTMKDAGGNVLQTGTGNSININWNSHPPGTYQVIADDISATYCNGPQSLFVTLYPSPPAPTTIAGQDSVCPGQSYAYSSSPSSTAYYLEWAITGGTPSNATGNNVTVTWNASPPYAVNLYQVTVANPSCSSLVYTKNVYPTSLGTPAIVGADSTCANSIASYSALPSNAESYTWSISPTTFGSIISGQGSQNVSVQWNNSMGVATLSLLVKGCADSAIVMKGVTLTAPPPPIILSSDSACQGSVFNFSSGTSGSAYSWSFGDGNTASSGSPSTNNTYTTTGSFNVTLTVTNPSGCIGTSTTSKFVVINPSPTANLTTPDPNAYCTGQTISTTMYINSQPGNTFQWFGPGATSFTGVSYTATAAGSYYVIVTGPNGCTTQSNTIQVTESPCVPCNIDPGSSISYSYSAPACNVVNFNGSISGNGSVIGWTFDDPESGVNNTSTLLSPSHTFTEAGYYHVYFTGLFPGTPDSCSLHDVQVVTIPAVADMQWKITGCAATGFLFDFFDKTNVVSPYVVNTWNWTFGSGTPSGSALQNPSGVLLTPGVHVVSLTITSSGSTICTVTDTINVPNLPVASFTSIDSVCDGNPVQFTSTSTGNLIEQLWDFGDMSGSLLAPVTDRTYDLPGTYIASLLVTDSFGCTSSVSKPIVVTPNTLSVGITAGGPTTFCQGDSVQLTANPGGGTPPYNYVWPNTGATSPSVMATLTGDYTVILGDLKGCLKTSAPVSVVVNEAPVAMIVGPTHYCADDVIELSANQGPANTYAWYVNGLPHSTGAAFTYQTSSLTPAVLNVHVVVTGPNGCSATSAVVQVNVHQLPFPPSITPSSTVLCAGTPITLTASNTQGLTQYSWNTGETGPSITVQQGGIYTVTVYNQYGCSAKTSLMVGDLPDFSTLMVGCYEFCDTGSVTWVGPAGFYTYQWLQNGIPIPGETFANYTIPVGAVGPFSLVMTTMNGCTDTSDFIDISFHSCQPCQGNFAIQSIVCGPSDSSGVQTYILTMHLSNPLTPGASYTLTTPTGLITGLTPSTLNPGSNIVTGIYTPSGPVDLSVPLCLQGEIMNAYGEKCEFKICSMLPPCDVVPCQFAPNFTFQIDPDAPCSVAFYGDPQLPAGMAVVSMLWTFGDGGTSNLQNPVHTYAANGSYYVCFLVQATNGVDTCRIELCKWINVKGCYNPCTVLPKFTFAQIDPCSFRFTDLTVPTGGGTIIDWHWDFGDGFTSTLQNPTHTYSANGIYTVCLTVWMQVGATICSNVFCIDIDVRNCKPGPCILHPAFDFDQTGPCTFQFTDYSTAQIGVNIFDWEWDFGDGNSINGIQNPTHTFSVGGLYTVCLTIYGYNGSEICKRKICWDIMVGDCDADSRPTSLQAWPNPSEGTYFLNVPADLITKENVKVMDAIGLEIPFSIGTENGKPFIRLQAGQSGVFLITLQKDNLLLTTTVVKN